MGNQKKRNFATQQFIHQNRQKMGTSKYHSAERKLDCVFEWGDSHEDWDVEEIHHSDLPMLPINIKRILCKHDCAMVHITPNQMVWKKWNQWGIFG